MNFHISRKLKITLLMFVIAFIVVMFLFIKKPHIVKSKNKYIRTIMVFAIAFVPGVMAASICAKTITTVWERFFDRNKAEITLDIDDDDDDDEKKKKPDGGNGEDNEQ